MRRETARDAAAGIVAVAGSDDMEKANDTAAAHEIIFKEALEQYEEIQNPSRQIGGTGDKRLDVDEVDAAWDNFVAFWCMYYQGLDERFCSYSAKYQGVFLGEVSYLQQLRNCRRDIPRTYVPVSLFLAVSHPYVLGKLLDALEDFIEWGISPKEAEKFLLLLLSAKNYPDYKTELYEGKIPVFKLHDNGKIEELSTDYWFSADEHYSLLFSIEMAGKELNPNNCLLLVKKNDLQAYIDKKYNSLEEEGVSEEGGSMVDISRLPSQVQTLIRFILLTEKENDLSNASRLSKVSLKKWLEDNWPQNESFCDYSDKNTDALATMLRDKAQGKGGYKK